MINVLHVADKLSLGGATLHGVARLFSMWIPRFDKSRFNLMVCSLRQRDQAAQYLENLGIDVFCLARGRFDPRTLKDLIRLIIAQKVDILHLHGYGAATFGRCASLISGIPAIVHEHMVDNGIPFYQRLADRLLSPATTGAVAISFAVKTFMTQKRYIPLERIKIIYNGVPITVAAEKTRKKREQPLRQQYGIPGSHCIVATVGRLDAIKGQRYFLQAAQKVLGRFPNVTFLVVGDGQLHDELQELSRQLCIDDNIRFTGFCEDIYSLLREIDIKVIGSLSEGGPLTLFEAMVCGCAVIATPVGLVPDVIQDGFNGLLITAEDASEMADKILFLLENERVKMDISKNAETSVKQYDILQTVNALEDVYERALTARKKWTARV